MRLFAISDLHLSFGVDKPMDIFGPQWVGHADKIRESWDSRIGDDDWVLVGGDTSWGLSLKEAQPDLDWLHQRTGQKILIKGNHCTWWTSRTKVQAVIGDSIHLLQNDAVKAILAYHWPGNVRELENKLNGAVILSEGKQIKARDLDLEVPDETMTYLNLRAARYEAERKVLRQALAQTAGNLSKASELLGITRPTIYDLMEKHNIAGVPE